MASVIYNNAKEIIAEGSLDFINDTIKVALVTSSYSPDIDSDVYFDDLTNEVSGTGYTTGGATIANIAVTQNDTDDLGKIDGDDVTWSTATITARGAVIYKDTGSTATSPLIAYVDFGSDKTASAADFTIGWSANGVLTIS